MTVAADPSPIDRNIAIAEIAESPTNPRHGLTDAAVADLTASIKQDGILQPLLVRPRTAVHGPAYELVFGHRRLRAARLAGLTHVPCRVRTIDDRDVARMQLVENMQREGLHPLDEADGLLALHKTHQVTIAQLVAQTGKSRSAIYARLKLVTLQDDARAAFRGGKLDAELALLVARVPPGKQQTAALKIATEPQWDGSAPSYRKVRHELLMRFTEGLKSAPFDIGDATLLEGISPQPIACTACPRRTGAAVDVFGDVVQEKDSYQAVRGPDVCTDPECYDAKRRAHLKRQAEALAARGKTVVTGAAASKALSKSMYSDKIEVKGDYIAVADVRADLKAKKAEVEVVHLQHSSGKVVQAVRKADLKAAGIKVESDSVKAKAGADDWEKRHAEAKAEAEHETAVHVQVFKALREHVDRSAPTADDLRVVVTDLLAGARDECDVLDLAALEASVPTMDLPALQRTALLLTLVDDVKVHSWRLPQLKKTPPALLRVAKARGVDVAAIRAQLSTPATPTPKSAAKAKPAKAKRAADVEGATLALTDGWPFPGRDGAGPATTTAEAA